MKKVKLVKDGAVKEVLEHVVDDCLEAGWKLDKPKVEKPKVKKPKKKVESE
jgi:hypothetical protein